MAIFAQLGNSGYLPATQFRTGIGRHHSIETMTLQAVYNIPGTRPYAILLGAIAGCACGSNCVKGKMYHVCVRACAYVIKRIATDR